jgi:hypothetical protein
MLIKSPQISSSCLEGRRTGFAGLAAVIRRATVNCIAQLEREAKEARKARDIELAQQLERDADEIRLRAAG